MADPATTQDIKAQRMAQASIGFDMKVRLDERTSLSGRIVQCTPTTKHVQYGRTSYRLFEAVLECGSAKVRHTVHVTKLPQPR